MSSNRRLLLSLVGAVAVLPACAASDSDTNPSTAFNQIASSYAADSQTHAASVSAASNVGRVQVLETDYISRTDGYVGGLRGDFGDMMQYCVGPGGVRPDGRYVDDDIDAIDDERHRHHTSMTAVSDLASARSEEARHQEAIGRIFGEMRSHADDMMEGEGEGEDDFVCRRGDDGRDDDEGGDDQGGADGGSHGSEGGEGGG